jgi:hypothetical protein
MSNAFANISISLAIFGLVCPVLIQQLLEQHWIVVALRADMAATFSFGFVGDDIDDEDAELDKAPKSEHNAATHTTSLPAKRHSLEDLVSHAVMQILAIFQTVLLVDLPH